MSRTHLLADLEQLGLKLILCHLKDEELWDLHIDHVGQLAHDLHAHLLVGVHLGLCLHRLPSHALSSYKQIKLIRDAACHQAHWLDVMKK